MKHGKQTSSKDGRDRELTTKLFPSDGSSISTQPSSPPMPPEQLLCQEQNLKGHLRSLKGRKYLCSPITSKWMLEVLIDTYPIAVFLFLIKMAAQLIERVLEEKWLIGCMKPTRVIWMERILHMMGKKFIYCWLFSKEQAWVYCCTWDVTSNRNNGNASLGGYDNPSAHDKKRSRWPYQSKTFRVKISFTANIFMQTIQNALRG